MDPPKGVTPVGSPFAILYLFEALETLRVRHGLVSCTLSQTTLEQVFNAMVAEEAASHGVPVRA